MSAVILGSTPLLPSTTIGGIEHDILHHGGVLSVHIGTGEGGGNIIAAGGATAAPGNTIIFSNDNNVSFGLLGGTVTASASVTGLALIDHDHGSTANATGLISGTIASDAWSLSIPDFAGTNFSSESITGYIPSGTLDTYGLKLGVPQWLTTAAQVSHIHGDLTTFSTDGTDIKYTSASNGLSLAIPNYITTYGGGYDLTLAGTNTSGTLAPIHSGTLTLAGGSNITLSQNGNAITISGASQTTHDHPYIGTESSSLFAGVGETVNTVSGTDFLMTVNTDGVNVEHPNWLTTALNFSVDGDNTLGTIENIDNGTVVLYGGSNISLSQDNNSITIIGTDNYTAIQGIVAQSATFTDGSIYLSAMSNINIQTYLNGASQFIRFSVPDYIGTSTAGTNVGLTVNSQGIRASVDTAGMSSFGDGYNYIGVDTITAASKGEVIFANSNGVHFGMSTNAGISSSTITASYTQSTHEHPYIASESTSVFGYTSNSSLFQHTTATSAITSAAINTSQSNLFQLTANNSLSLGTGYTTHTHDYQSTGAYLTTAMASDAGSLFIYDSNSTLFLTSVDSAIKAYELEGTNSLGTTYNTLGSILYLEGGSNITLSGDNNTIRIIGESGGTNTGGVGIIASDATYTSGNVEFRGTNITINTSAGGQYVDLIGMPQGQVYYSDSEIIFGSSVNGISTTITAEYEGFPVAAGTIASTWRYLIFGDSNNVSFGLNPYNILTASVDAIGGAALQGSGTYTQNSGTIKFETGNGVTFGLTDDVMTADFGSSQFMNASDTGSVYFQGSNGLYFGSSSNSNSTSITASYAQQYYLLGNTGGSSSFSGGSNVSLYGGDNITLSVNTDNQLIIQGESGGTGGGGVAIGDGASTITAGTALFSDANNVSFGISGNTVTASIPQGSVYFSDGYGISFNSSTTTGSASINTTIYGSVNTLGASAYPQVWQLSGNTGGTSSSNNFVSGSILRLYGDDNITLSGGSAGISIIGASGGSGGGGVVLYDGANSISSGTASFADGRGVSFGINGQTITGSINAMGTNISTSGDITALANTNGLSITAPTIGYLYFSNSHVSWGSSANGISTSIYGYTS